MSETLTGRALDRAVFDAITNRKFGSDLLDGLFANPLFARYSDDETTLPEMVKWLTARGEVQLRGIPSRWESRCGWEDGNASDWTIAAGTTMSEAVARLVVLFAATKEKP